jgi:hypothetical protein
MRPILNFVIFISSTAGIAKHELRHDVLRNSPKSLATFEERPGVSYEKLGPCVFSDSRLPHCAFVQEAANSSHVPDSRVQTHIFTFSIALQIYTSKRANTNNLDSATRRLCA